MSPIVVLKEPMHLSVLECQDGEVKLSQIFKSLCLQSFDEMSENQNEFHMYDRITMLTDRLHCAAPRQSEMTFLVKLLTCFDVASKGTIELVAKSSG